MINKKCTFLVGSPRGFASSSYKIAKYLFEKFNERGYTGEIIFLKTVVDMNSYEFNKSFINKFKKSGLIVFSFPLYVDSIPYITIRTMELIANEYKNNGVDIKQKLLSIVNSGFPEPSQCDTAIEICKQFSKELDIDWAGGLKIGGGPMLNSQSFVKENGMLKKYIKGLDMIVDTIIEGRNITKDTLDIFNKPLIPVFLYKLMGEIGWRIQAKKNNVWKKLWDRPYSIK